MMLNLHGTRYALGEVLTQGPHHTLYRAVRQDNQQPVILKVLEPKQFVAKDLEQLENEFFICNVLTHALGDHAGVMHSESIVTQTTSPTIVFKHVDGEILSQLGKPQGIHRFLPWACRITEALALVHRAKVIHKDIRPHNILLNTLTGQVYLGGFGIATQLRGAPQAVGHLTYVDGTLAYSSPEQTGRMNRGVDRRCDLYSLGVTFYEMLAGRLPFAAHDSLEWVHCHIAKVPELLHTLNSTIPPTLSHIVAKLLQKVPEDRYQTADGLLHDLQICSAQYLRSGHIEPFDLGKNDISDIFAVVQKLYGREHEVNTLLSAFGAVAERGNPAVLTVSGYSGVGKSSLVHELYKPIICQRGHFISGKFDQHRRHMPYLGMIAAFRDLIAQVLTESEEQVRFYAEHIVESLGKSAAVIADVVGEVELLIGPQSPVPTLAPAEAQNRLTLAFQNFIRVFAHRGRPLVIFLDDMQWADSATLELIYNVLNGTDVSHLFFILAYRNNEVDATHPFDMLLKRLHLANLPISEVLLHPLDLVSLNQMVADTLRCRTSVVLPLAQLILKKTGGNPFFTTEFLKTLHRDGLLVFNHTSKSWQWDQRTLEAKNITDNVVDLMVSSLRRLPPTSQKMLQLASCIGTTFDLETLARVNHNNTEETAAALREAIENNYVMPIPAQPQRSAVAGTLNTSPTLYRFSHDRIVQAAYALIPDGDKVELHYQIGSIMLEHADATTLDDKLFDIVNQLTLPAIWYTAPHCGRGWPSSIWRQEKKPRPRRHSCRHRNTIKLQQNSCPRMRGRPTTKHVSRSIKNWPSASICRATWMKQQIYFLYLSIKPAIAWIKHRFINCKFASCKALASLMRRPRAVLML